MSVENFDDERYVANKMGQTLPGPSPVEGEQQEQIVPQFLEPCGNRIVVQADPFKEPSRIIKTPDNAKKRPTTGRVVAVGSGAIDPITYDPAFKVGDRVLYGNFSGTMIQFKGRPAYVILSTDEVLARITVDEEQLDFAS